MRRGAVYHGCLMAAAPKPIPPNQQQALVDRLIETCGGAYSPLTRRKYFISGPQWAAAYEGQALFHAPTRQPVNFEEVIRQYGRIGIGHWCTHDTDVIPTEALGKEEQARIVERIKNSLRENGLECSMVTRPRRSPVPVRCCCERCTFPSTRTCEADIEIAKQHGRPTLKHCLEAKPFEPQAEILLPTSDSMLAFIASGLLKHPEMVGLNPEYLHELMWGGAPRAALARALLAGKLFHFDINDGYRLKHDVDIGVGLVNPLDWLNVLVLLRSHDYNGPFNLDFKPPRTTSNHGVFAVSFPTAVDRFITLWEMAGDVVSDPVIKEATGALKSGGGPVDAHDAQAVAAANRELLTLHELIAHRIFQILIGAHRGRTYSL